MAFGIRTPILLLAVSLCGLTGCKAKPAPDTGFLDNPDRMTAQERYPFHRAYWDGTYDPARYTELYVAPVNTEFMLQQTDWQKTNIRQDHFEADTQEVAKYMQTALVNAAITDRNHRFKVVRSPGPKTMILEVALVELVPSKIILNTLGLGASAVPGAGAAVGGAAAGVGAKSSIAMEARVRDGASGNVIGMFADREEPAARVLDLGGLNWYHYANAIIDTWAAQMIEVANTPADHIVEDSAPFTLAPW